jgi:iron complex transport system permease protein
MQATEVQIAQRDTAKQRAAGSGPSRVREGWRRIPPAAMYASLFVLLIAVALASLLVGSGDLSDVRLSSTFLELRATRFAAAFLAGTALAVGGVIVQGLFRNPLAEPSILGTTAGASLGGKIAMLSFQLLAGGAVGTIVAPEMILPLGCVIGACAALAVLLAVQRTGDDVVVLLLTGFLLSSLFVALGGLATSLAMERWELARAMLDFALGDVSGVGIERVMLAAPLVVFGLIASWLWAPTLDLMLSGEEEAAALGVEVREVRIACVLWAGILTAAAVSIGGQVGFVGLIVPHALRPVLGVSHRKLIPAAALLGGTFVAACDVLTRSLPTRAEMPLGVVTGLIGAPLFLFLLLRSRREASHV